MTTKKGGGRGGEKGLLRHSEGDVGIHSQREEVKPASEGLASD